MKTSEAQVARQQRLVAELYRRLRFELLLLERMERPDARRPIVGIKTVLERAVRRDERGSPVNPLE